MAELRRLLATTDFSTLGNYAVERAARLARDLGASLDVVHVVDDVCRRRGDAEKQHGQKSMTDSTSIQKRSREDQWRQNKAVLDPLLWPHQLD